MPLPRAVFALPLLLLAAPAAALTCMAPQDQARLDASRAELVVEGRAAYLPGEAAKTPPAEPSRQAQPVPIPIPVPVPGAEGEAAVAVPLNLGLPPKPVARRVRVEIDRVLQGEARPGDALEAVYMTGPCVTWAPDGGAGTFLLMRAEDGGWRLLGEKTKP